jgi:replicative DNA helicase
MSTIHTDLVQPPPSAPMAEKAILSCMMMKPARFIARASAEGISEESFSTPAHRQLFHSITSDYHRTGSLDLIAFIQARQLDGTLDSIGGPAAVAEIHNYAMMADGWTQWVSQAKETQALRTAQQAAHKLHEAGTSEEAIAEASAALEAIRTAAQSSRRSITAREAGKEFMAAMLADHEAGGIPGASTGIHELDEASGGMKPGQLWVIAGHTSRGKSVLMLQITGAFLLRGQRVALFTLELMAREVFGRLVSTIGRVNFQAITKPATARKYELEQIRSTCGSLMESELYLDPAETPTIETIRAEAQRIRDATGGLDLIVVDYLQLIEGTRLRNDTRESEIAKVSRGLKRLAKELKCPVITASQLNDDGKTRESRSIVQDADALIFITEDGLKIGKMRNGPRDAALPLFLDGAHQRFTHRTP